jgi:Cof subfamily protein (haloacid dehalogenase superfamily)
VRPKLVALDIDGTLLDSSGELRPAVRRAVREAMRGDVVVTLATGRRFDTAADVAAELGVEVPLVLHGGAVIQDSLTGEVLYEDAMPAALLREVVEEVVREGRQPVLYRSPAVNDLLAGPRELDNPASATYLERQPCVRRLPVEELARAEHVISVGVLHQEDVLRPLYERFRSWPTCSALLWEPEPLWPDYPYLLDVVNAGCSKAKALAHFAGTYGIQMGEVMAIGDQINDVDMIEAVGFGVAMGNAIPAVRERAQVVVGTNDEDGVVEALRRFVLNGETPE